MARWYLFRGDFWRTYWISLRRFHRDRRARRYVLLNTALLIYISCYLWFFIGPFVRAKTNDTQAEARFQVLLLVVILSGAGLTFLLHRWLERRDNIPSIAAKSSLPGSPDEPLNTMELWRATCLLAALLQRSGSEMAIQKNPIPEGMEATTRRKQREHLIALSLWDDLPAAVRNLLLLPDGQWPETSIHAVLSMHEVFFTLQWALGQQDRLQTLDRIPLYDGKKVLATLAGSRPDQPMLLPPWDLRAAREETDLIFGRFWMESVARRLINQELTTDVLAQVEAAKANLDEGGGASTDLLVGAKTVSELDDAVVLQMAAASYRRWEVLALLTRIATRDAPVSALQDYLLGLYGGAD